MPMGDHDLLLGALSAWSEDAVLVWAGAAAPTVNAAGLRLIGASAETDLVGIAITDLVVADEHDRVLGTILPAVARDGSWEGPLHLRERAGQPVPVRCRLLRLDRAEDGSPRLVLFARDLRDRRGHSDAFLVRLDDATRQLSDPREITQTAARLLGEHLGVNRCAYAEVEEDEDAFDLVGDYNHGVPSIVGRYRFADFGADCLRLMREDRPYVVEDAEADPRTAGVRAAYRATLIRSVICVPLRKRGRFAAAMAVHLTTVRRWRQDEVDLVLRVANRCWESIERARAVADLRRQWQTFDVALAHTPDFTYIFDREGRFTYVNQALLALWRKPLHEVVGRDFHALGIPSGLASRHQDEIQRVIATRRPVRDQTPFTGPSGETRQYEYIFVPVLAEDGHVVAVAGSTRDITDRMRIEDDLRRSNERLLRANRELEQFAFIASHDLQEPLRMVSSYLSLLRRTHGGSLDQRGLEFLSRATDGAERMHRMISSLLEFAMLDREELRQERVDVHDVVVEALHDLEVRIDETGARVEIGPLPPVRGDRGHLVRLFVNLIGNALKYRRPEVAPVVSVSAHEAEGERAFTVTDNGVGIPAGQEERIFELFQRLDGAKAQPGSGIGLAVCRKIVERHHGRIWLCSQPGAGATFCFTLPPA